jgi:hypothetical protein
MKNIVLITVLLLSTYRAHSSGIILSAEDLSTQKVSNVHADFLCKEVGLQIGL